MYSCIFGKTDNLKQNVRCIYNRGNLTWVKKKIMSRSLLTALFCLFFLLSLDQLNGQTYNFTNYTVENGLSQPQVLSVFQDNSGVMWFGTNGGGITKYDGNSFEHITDKNGLADNVVYSIVKDQKGRILIGTNKGLSVFDGKKFKNFTTQNGLSHDRVYTIFITPDNQIFLGTGKGLSLFKDTFCTAYTINEAIDNALIFNIYQDSKQNFWFSTLGSGAYRYNGKEVKNYSKKDGLKNEYFYSVLEQGNEHYWFFMHEGLYELKDNKINQITITGVANDASFYGYAKDHKGNLWIASSAGGIKCKNNTFVLYSQKNGLVNNTIWKIIEDKEKNIWLASKDNGISKLANESFYMYTTNDGLPSNAINCIYQSKDGRYWIGSKKGLSILEGKIIKNYNQKDWKYNPDITAIAESADGTLYIGTSYGALHFNGKIFERIEASDLKRGLNYIHDIYIDKNGTVWLGTKLGVAQINNGKIVEFNYSGTPNNFIYKINQDNNGNYWFATENGAYRFDGNVIKHFTEKDGLTTKQVSNILIDSLNNSWFVTANGIYKYSNEEFSGITIKEGLLSNIVQSLVINKKQVLWAGFPNGVDKIIPLGNNDYEIRHYVAEDGFLSEDCTLNSILLDNQNKVWFGTSKGLVVYQPEYDKKNEVEPYTYIKSIYLFGQKQDWKYFADSLDRNNLPVNLKLAHDRNYLAFNFVGVSLTAPAKVRYKYMLKGLDKDWLPQTAKTEAIYSNIPPGNYEFLVIANNGDGVWNKQPASFKFTIAPPFWQTWWFYSIIAVIILSGIFSYVKIKSSNIKIIKQNHIIEEKNAELKQAYVQIAGKNKSITDSINYAQRIQHSFLTSESVLNYCLKDFFILYKPRDIVSGDFYWAFDLPDRTLVACADSTGHGIPGAFMSLIGISLLNEISHSKKMIEPAGMLDELRRIIICALNPEQADDGGKDGMDIALISIFKSTDSDHVKIHFAGANNTIYLISEQNDTKELTEFKGDKQPVGFYSSMKPFKQHEIIAKKGDIIYMHTDGFADQFGGQKAKKIMSKQLKNTLLAISDLPQKRQQELLDRTFLEWKGELEQVDDVTVIGIKLGSKLSNIANPHKMYSEQLLKESIQCQTIEEFF